MACWAEEEHAREGRYSLHHDLNSFCLVGHHMGREGVKLWFGDACMLGDFSLYRHVSAEPCDCMQCQTDMR